MSISVSINSASISMSFSLSISIFNSIIISSFSLLFSGANFHN